nr:DciA family protein [Sphingomicrobium flavum]
MAFKRFGFVQGAVVHRWGEIVGERYARVSLPESIKFPQGHKAGGTLTLLVESAHAPLIQHLAPMIIEKVNAFFGYGAISKVVFRQGKVPARKKAPMRPAPRPVPKEIGEGLREIADPELRTLLESMAAGLENSAGKPTIIPVGKLTDPISKRRDNDQ